MPSATLPAVRASFSPFHTLLYDPMQCILLLLLNSQRYIGLGCCWNQAGIAQKIPDTIQNLQIR